MKKLRLLLWPFALPYDLITRLRNVFFDRGIFAERTYDFPVIGVGNLSMGGTGKTPMIEYLVELLNQNYRLGILSRGYGRNTNGYLDVEPHLSAAATGDEPLQFARKYADVQVAVSEKRTIGIDSLRNKAQAPDVILLDDVFQHRHVKPGLLIMLTAFDDLFYNDFVLPAGNLRESRSGAKRADVVVVTKCKEELTETSRTLIKRKIRRYTYAPVFFSRIAYGLPTGKHGILNWADLKNQSITVVTGIAKPKPFLDHLNKLGLDYEYLEFNDHHAFSEIELQELDQKQYVLTTEKDYVRLAGKLKNARLVYLPIKVEFLAEKMAFNSQILEFVKNNLPA